MASKKELDDLIKTNGNLNWEMQNNEFYDCISKKKATEKLDKMLDTQDRIYWSTNAKEIDILTKVFNSQYDKVAKKLEIFDIFERIVTDLVFNDDPYCNLVITDAENVIDVDYDSKAPDVEMTCEEYDKVKEYLKNDMQKV